MASAGKWITRGFEAFRRGTFGNAGQNIYVSRKGVLQRIHLFDLNRDGWFDLLLCNAQEHWEKPPAYVYDLTAGRADRHELPSDGAVTGLVADLNGDGFDEFVLGMENNGIERKLNAFVYFGGPDGWSEERHMRLPAPLCRSIAAGDFNGDGQIDLAMSCEDKVRVFYRNDMGYDARRFVEPGIAGRHLAAADLDGDGFDDLFVIAEDGAARVYWGGKAGIRADQFTDLPVRGAAAVSDEVLVSLEESSGVLGTLAKVFTLNGVPHLFIGANDHAILLPVRPDRTFGSHARLSVNRPMSAALGACGLVVAARDGSGDNECSWLYHPGPDGFSDARRTALPSKWACDVAIGDADGDGNEEIILCQHRTESSYTVDSPVFRVNRDGSVILVRQLTAEGARRVFLTRGPTPRVAFVNQAGRNALGEVPPTIYWGGPDGFDENRRTDLSGLGAVAGVGCDVNDDGIPDLITSNCAENAIHIPRGAYVFHGRPDGFRPEHDIELPTINAMNVIVGDVNRDGYLDAIFVSFSTNEALIFFGNETGFDLKNPQRIVVEHEGVKYIDGRRMCLADLNNDGWLDLVLTFISGDRAFILWGGPDGFSFDRKQVLSLTRPSTPMVADLTGNGYLDLILAGHKRSDSGPHDSFVHIYWNGPEGLHNDRRMQLPANAVLGMALADFNNDGVLDLFVGNYSNGRERDLDSYVYWGSNKPGEPMFSEQRRLDIRTHSAAGCVAADFNLDGRVDLAVANHKTHGDHIGHSFVYWNNEGGIDWHHPTRLPSRGPHGMYHTAPGNLRDRGEEEYYVSEPHQMPSAAKVQRIEWKAELSPRTWVKARFRAASSSDALAAATWTAWQDNGPASVNAGPWIQYELALGATNSGGTPRITEVEITYG